MKSPLGEIHLLPFSDWGTSKIVADIVSGIAMISLWNREDLIPSDRINRSQDRG